MDTEVFEEWDAMNEKPPADQTPFEKFRDLARKLVSVPKAEVVAKEKAAKRKKLGKKK